MTTNSLLFNWDRYRLIYYCLEVSGHYMLIIQQQRSCCLALTSQLSHVFVLCNILYTAFLSFEKLQSLIVHRFHIRGLFFFSTSDRASKEVRNTREPDLRVA